METSIPRMIKPIVKSLFKYFPSHHLNAFVERGELLFRSLSYFRNYEELKVRGDRQTVRETGKSPMSDVTMKDLTPLSVVDVNAPSVPDIKEVKFLP